MLLDTCAILWLASGGSKLSNRARAAIASNPEELFVSAMSAFEIGSKYMRGRIDLHVDATQWWREALTQHRLRVVPVTDEIALACTALSPIHGDPCDRLIIASAAAFGMKVVTSDRLIARYAEVAVIW